MRTTLNLDPTLIKKAAQLTGIKEKTALIKAGLQALITQESSKRLAKLGGSESHLKAAPRRKAAKSSNDFS